MTISTPPTQHDLAALGSLRRRWGIVALLYTVIWWLSYQLLQVTWQVGFAARWRYFSAMMGFILLAILWRGLPHNRRSETSRLWPTLGHANRLSLLRGILLFLLAGFIFLPRPTIALTWLPALLYTADRITDLFDGYLARITRRESKLGAILDIELDGLGLLVAVILGVQYGLLPSWYLLLSVSRQLFVAGLAIRQWAGLPNRELPPSDNRRVIAGFQTGFLTVMLWPIMTPAITNVAAYLFAIPLIYSFGRDWLVVSHWIDPTSARCRQIRSLIKRSFEEWLPLLARLSTLICLFLLLWPLWRDDLAWATFAEAWGHQPSELTRYALLSLALVAAVGIATGSIARIAALLLMALAVFSVGASELSWQGNGWLFVSSLVIAHLGSGRWSWWQPEERWLHTQYGKSED